MYFDIYSIFLLLHFFRGVNIFLFAHPSMLAHTSSSEWEWNVIENQIKIISTVVKMYIVDLCMVFRREAARKIYFPMLILFELVRWVFKSSSWHVVESKHCVGCERETWKMTKTSSPPPFIPSSICLLWLFHTDSQDDVGSGNGCDVQMKNMRTHPPNNFPVLGGISIHSLARHSLFPHQPSVSLQSGLRRSVNNQQISTQNTRVTRHTSSHSCAYRSPLLLSPEW